MTAGTSPGGSERGGNRWRQFGATRWGWAAGATALTPLGQVHAPEEVDEQNDADRNADEDLRPAQRPSCARTASIRGGTVVGRDADSSAVSGSFRPCPVRVSTTVAPGSKRPALTHLIRPARVAADAGSMKMPSSRASMR